MTTIVIKDLACVDRLEESTMRRVAGGVLIGRSSVRTDEPLSTQNG